jgi:hypothetical protein
MTSRTIGTMPQPDDGAGADRVKPFSLSAAARLVRRLSSAEVTAAV